MTVPSLPTTEGHAPFSVPSANKPCQTYYKIIGDLSSTKTPLVALHGGPGCCHDYLLPLTDLYTTHGTPVIFYDQLGNGRSTHLSEKNGDASFWTEALFRDELSNLLSHLQVKSYDILGHSWGGMLGAAFATHNPEGLRRLVVSNSPASIPLWIEVTGRLRESLPREVQEVLDRCEREGRTESKEYEEAVEVFYRRFLCRVEPWPAQEVEAALRWLSEDPTVYGTMNGPSEFTITGSLKTWSIIDRLPLIDAQVLIINGSYDEAQDSCVAPYFEHIRKVKWITVEGASHFTHVERRGRYMQVVGDFLG